MAKTSSIQRNLKRIKLTEKFQKKRNDLKRIIKNKRQKLILTWVQENKIVLIKKRKLLKNFMLQGLLIAQLHQEK